MSRLTMPLQLDKDNSGSTSEHETASAQIDFAKVTPFPDTIATR